MIDLSLTIPDLFLRAIREHGDEPALLTKYSGQFKSSTWAEVGQEVARTVDALVNLRLLPAEHVVQISENRREWVIFDLACHLTGKVHVPLHASLSATQLAEQINHCQAPVVLLSTPEQARKLEQVRDRLSADVQFFSYDPCPSESLVISSWASAVEQGTVQRSDAGGRLDSVQMPHDLATILYTSGTTGEPKGVMLRQRNLSFNAQGTVEMYGAASERETRLNILPLSHIFARTCDLYAWLVRGSTLALAESRESVLEDLQLVRPTTINGVPYFFERLRKILCERGLEKPPGALQQLLGGRIRSCTSGGAPLSPATIDFFAAQEIPLLQGYGLTESSPVITMSPLDRYRPGTSGLPLPGVEIRLADDGEVLTRGPHVMEGYYQNPAATAKAIRDGWLHTGDLGQIDRDGYLTINGRKKELIVLSTGKKIAPSLLENRLLQEPLIAQAMVVGEGRSHLAALIVPNPEALRREIGARGISLASREEALVHPQVLAIYLEHIAALLVDLSPQEQVRHVTLVPRAFSIEQDEITPKLTLRRAVICQNFATEIDAMFESETCTQRAPP